MYRDLNWKKRVPAFQQAGEIVTARIWNSLENVEADGKWRPAVLIENHGGHWLAMGLTTRDSYASGKPRVPVPNSIEIGLKTQGFLWGDKLTRVSRIDIGFHIGWADDDLLDEIEDLVWPHSLRQ